MSWRKRLSRIDARLEKYSRPLWLAVCTVLVVFIGLLDYLTGAEIALAFFYLVPVSAAAWYANAATGAAISFLSAWVWLMAEVASGRFYSHPLIPYWNAINRLGFFLVVAYLLPSLHRALERERELARTDGLTGTVNHRHFLTLARAELVRNRRYAHPLTLAYIDLDDFKKLNDRYGHAVGDAVLKTVGRTALAHLRQIDTIARLGGDEFAILLPETGLEAARAAVGKVHRALTAAMQQRGWPVTFSIGVVVFVENPASVDVLLRRADAEMYAVKRAGKGNIRFARHPDAAGGE